MFTEFYFLNSAAAEKKDADMEMDISGTIC